MVTSHVDLVIAPSELFLYSVVACWIYMDFQQLAECACEEPLKLMFNAAEFFRRRRGTWSFNLIVNKLFVCIYPVSIDYGCYDDWFSQPARHCQVQAPTSQNLNLQQTWILGITNHEYLYTSRTTSIAWKLNYKLPNLCRYRTKRKHDLREVWVGIWKSIQGPVFQFVDEQVALEDNQRHFWSP